jgi:hypothetical protein
MVVQGMFTCNLYYVLCIYRIYKMYMYTDSVVVAKQSKAKQCH